MAPVGIDSVTGGGVKPGVSLLLNDGDTCVPAVWIVFMGTV